MLVLYSCFPQIFFFKANILDKFFQVQMTSFISLPGPPEPLFLTPFSVDVLFSLLMCLYFMCITQIWTSIFGSGAEYVRKEVPLHVLPTLSPLNLESSLTSFTDLQSVLYEEERTAYHQAILQNMRFIRYLYHIIYNAYLMGLVY